MARKRTYSKTLGSAEMQIELTDGLPNLTPALAGLIAQANFISGHNIITHVKTSMVEPKTGRAYPRRGGNVHIASAPGESPAVDTSTYMNSIEYHPVGATEGVVSTNIEYGPHLEFGAPGIGLAPRPHFRPAVLDEQDEYSKNIRHAIEVAAKETQV